MAAPDVEQRRPPPHELASTPSATRGNEGEDIVLTIRHQTGNHTFSFPMSATVSDLSTHISNTLSVPPSSQKLLISPRPGLLKPPFDLSTPHGSIPLHTLTDSKTKITLLGSSPAAISSLDTAIATSQRLANRRAGEGGPVKAATPAPRRDWKTLHDATTYTFGECKPLPYLPNPSRSLRFLERLANDAGIKSVMARHQWRVGLLTEMDPAQHTTHESRTLGLNRNAGEVIELRLRTDAYDGYRDYRTIRKTLCHELTHNVFGEHDARFWKLCGEVEKEVDKGDWRSGGRSVGEDEFYNPNDGGIGDHVDGGAWTGGSYVLGGSGQSAGEAGQGDRRAAMARAAEERARKAREGES